MSRCPWLAARCRGVSSPRFMTLMRAPLMMSMSTTLERPSRHAQCRGLKPWSSLGEIRANDGWTLKRTVVGTAAGSRLITLARTDGARGKWWWTVRLEKRNGPLGTSGAVLKKTSCSITPFGHYWWCILLPTWVSFVIFEKQIKIIHLIELGPRSTSRRTTWWCDLRTEGVLLNELESEPSASTAIKSLACVHTPRWSLLKTASGAPQSPSVLQQADICASESPVVTPDLMWEQLPVRPKGQMA